MDMFQKIKEKLGLVKKEEKTKTEEIMEERNELKITISTKLYNAGCSDEEVEEVLAIIQSAEDDIHRIKVGLVGTNINPQGDPMKPLYDGVEAIRARKEEMGVELQEDIKRILKDKKGGN